jgi:hypothetical protein
LWEGCGDIILREYLTQKECIEGAEQQKSMGASDSVATDSEDLVYHWEKFQGRSYYSKLRKQSGDTQQGCKEERFLVVDVT